MKSCPAQDMNLSFVQCVHAPAHCTLCSHLGQRWTAAVLPCLHLSHPYFSQQWPQTYKRAVGNLQVSLTKLSFSSPLTFGSFRLCSYGLRSWSCYLRPKPLLLRMAYLPFLRSVRKLHSLLTLSSKVPGLSSGPIGILCQVSVNSCLYYVLRSFWVGDIFNPEPARHRVFEER